MPYKAIVLLANGLEEIEAVTPVDVLRRGGLQVTTAGLEGKTVLSSHAIPIQADLLLEEAGSDYDLLVLPGGMPGSEKLGQSAAAKSLAVTLLNKSKRVAAICAAPVLTLGAWGLLSGKKATCHPGMETGFPPDVTFVAEKVVTDGLITTSRGAGTALPFALHLLELFEGAEKMQAVSRGVVFP